ncbi:MAG: DUF7226 domain-containing protein [Sphaerochaeta sp.]
MNEITLPQANNLNTVFMLLLNVPSDITECFNNENAAQLIEMDIRQGSYYLSALEYFSFIKKVTVNSYVLSEKGKLIVNEENKEIRFLNFIFLILQNKEFSYFYHIYKQYEIKEFKRLYLQYCIVTYKDKLLESTIIRRFSTIKKWCIEIDTRLVNFL